jgi:hypothetical protein
MRVTDIRTTRSLSRIRLDARISTDRVPGEYQQLFTSIFLGCRCIWWVLMSITVRSRVFWDRGRRILRIRCSVKTDLPSSLDSRNGFNRQRKAGGSGLTAGRKIGVGNIYLSVVYLPR